MTIILIAFLINFSYNTGLTEFHLPSEKEKAELFKNKPFSRPVNLPDTLKAFDVFHYFLDLFLKPSYDSIKGSVKVKFWSLSDTFSILKLHLVGFVVDSCKRNGLSLPFSRVDSNLFIYLLSPLPNGDSATVQVFYHGSTFRGLYMSSNLFYAHNEPYDAKRWYPCYDDPSDKALADIKVTVPQGFRVVANGVLVDSGVTQQNNWFYHWRENYPVATYLIVIAGRTNHITLRDTFIWGNDTMPILNYGTPSDSSIILTRFVRTPLMLNYFSNTFLVYPFLDEKYGHVNVPIGGAMENQTNTFINMYANWGSDWDWVISHELAHHWFGDQVTCKTWKDIWLNEGFASYCEALWFGARDGESAYHSYIAGMMNYAIQNEPYPPFPIYDPDYLFSFPVVYRKGASVLHMLRHVMGDSLFFEGIRQYLLTYSYKSATTENLRNVLENVYGQGLYWFFDEWVYSPGHPVYECLWFYDSIAIDSFRISLRIKQIQSHNYGVPLYTMPVDIWIVTQNSDTLKYVVWNFLDDQSYVFYSTSKPLDLLFDPGNWILKELYYIDIDEKIIPEAPEISLNIFENRVLLYINSSVPKRIQLDLYDITGRKLNTLFNGNIKENKKSFFIYRPSGIYFLKLNTGNKTITKKFFLLKMSD